jgi:hypothetical protein
MARFAMTRCAMSLNFIGERGVYLTARDAIKIVAIDGGRAFDCMVNRSALDAIGCAASLDTSAMVHQFETHRIDIEVAAMIKYRRMLTPCADVINIDAEDLRQIVRPPAG